MSDPVHDNLRSALDDQIEAFLSKGGEITEVPTGTSGMNTDAKKTQWSRGNATKPAPKIQG